MDSSDLDSVVLIDRAEDLDSVVELFCFILRWPSMIFHDLPGGLVKFVKLVNTFILQNQRLKKPLYRIDFNGNFYRIILDGLAPK